MNAADLIRRLHEHRIWVNRNLRQAAAELSPQALRQSFAIGQGSIWQSLLHLYAAEYVWLGTLLGNEATLTPGDV
ncbi:MAG TPA: DinB family protein, partial [Pirellulales bacterium]